jgi:hypothetical protein
MRILHLFASIILASLTTVCVAQETKRPPVPARIPPPVVKREPGSAADDASSPSARQVFDQCARIARVADSQIRVALALHVARAADKNLSTGLAADLSMFDSTLRALSSIDPRGLPPQTGEAWSALLQQRGSLTIATQQFRDFPSPETEKEYNDAVINRKAAADKLFALLPDVLAPTLTASATDLEIRDEVATWLQQLKKRKRPIFC